MAVAAPSTLPMKLRKEESCGKAAAGFGSDARSRVLVTVTVLGSAGPLRFLVDEGETVAGLIRAALRCYARKGHMPLLGADPAEFLLYTANSRSDALKADERISFNGCRRTTGGGDSASGGEEDDPALQRARRRTTPPPLTGDSELAAAPGKEHDAAQFKKYRGVGAAWFDSGNGSLSLYWDPDLGLVKS
ncbi:hypothetical protein EJB05_08704, partial [Eragrostis curvula]